MTATEAARRWADAWRQGWQALDPEPIIARYAADALLSTEPFREPYRGREGVRELEPVGAPRHLTCHIGGR